MPNTEFTADEITALERKTTVARFLFGPLGVLAMLMLARPWPADHGAVSAFWTLTLSYCMFCWTSCFHETVHHTLFAARWANVWIGRAIGTMIFVPYTVYRESHIRHHAYLNKPGDWELWPYSDPSASLGFRRFFCWLELPLGVFTTPIAYGRLFFHKNSPLTKPAIRAAIRREYLSMLTVWGLVVGTVAWWPAWMLFAKVWVIPHLIAGFFQAIRKFTEHLGMQSYDPLLGTRTVIGTSPITRWSTFLNFDIFVHGVHHRHPRIAHDQLAPKMLAYRDQDPTTKYPIFDTYWSAIRHMLPSLWRNPGVGMNVGAPLPAPTEPLVLDGFVADVTQEILAPSEATLLKSRTDAVRDGSY